MTTPQPTEDAELRLIGLTKRFGPVTAVDDLHLRVPSGAFIALLGPSGCGKTTTLRMVAGLEAPTAGQILLGDSDLTGLKPYRRPVNTVFQSYALFPHLDIYENVAFGLRRSGIKDVRAQVGQMLELVQLTGFERRRPSQVSGGQAQRVALARALINHPKMLLLDEPLGALDLKLRREMQLTLKRIQEEVRITFLHVTHDQEEAMTMADTIAVMSQGRIEQLGHPEQLYERPRTQFVANFLGQSNMLRATVDGRDGDLVTLRIADTTLVVPAEMLSHGMLTASGEVHVGVRPEKLDLAPVDDPVPQGRNALRGVVVDTSFMGTSTQYLVRTGWDQELTVFAQNRHTDVVAPGTRVRLTWRPEHAFVLDADTPTSAAAPQPAVAP
ncbi:MAG: ABC transporter ATP-binding protein [Euzebyaceae bacterium]|nr:ABC transporter ATP-binding protein [Euzebyaceae bacterium]